MASSSDGFNVELNLAPFIDLMSVLNIFLLLTAVWTHMGSIDAKQAMGGQAATAGKSAKVWVQIFADNRLQMKVTDAPAGLDKGPYAGIAKDQSIPSDQGKVDFKKMESILSEMRKAMPGLGSALIQPKSGVIYENVIRVMDHAKKAGLVELGISPL